MGSTSCPVRALEPIKGYLSACRHSMYKPDVLSQNTKYRGESNTGTTSSNRGQGSYRRCGRGHQKQRTATLSELNKALNKNTDRAAQTWKYWALTPRVPLSVVGSPFLQELGHQCHTAGHADDSWGVKTVGTRSIERTFVDMFPLQL